VWRVRISFVKQNSSTGWRQELVDRDADGFITVEKHNGVLNGAENLAEAVTEWSRGAARSRVDLELTV
jgi:hypothetical protein